MKFDQSSFKKELQDKKNATVLIVLCVVLVLYLIFGVNWDWVFGFRQ